MSDAPKTFYATFGFNQSLRNCYVKIEAVDYGDARRIMHEHHGNLFAFMYDADKYDTAIARYNLIEVPLGTPNAKEYD